MTYYGSRRIEVKQRQCTSIWLPYKNTLGADQALTGIEPATPNARAVTNEPMRLV